jgi:serralysin
MAVLGGTGSNLLSGHEGADTLIGGLGHDTLEGGIGKDRLTGGGGFDLFRIMQESDSGVRFSERDVINTFAHGDKIDLSGIDANSRRAGDQSFSFIGDDAFTGRAGQLRYDMTNISATGVKSYVVYGDINGDRVADLSLQIYTAPTRDRMDGEQSWHLEAWDFVL